MRLFLAPLLVGSLASWALADAQNTSTPPQQDSLAHPSPTATVKPAIGGPMPEQQGLPVNSKQIPAESKIQKLDVEIADVQKQLQSKKLSAKKRQSLEKKLGELSAERMSIPVPLP